MPQTKLSKPSKFGLVGKLVVAAVGVGYLIGRH